MNNEFLAMEKKVPSEILAIRIYTLFNDQYEEFTKYIPLQDQY